jgi:molecular chaperone GrpE
MSEKNVKNEIDAEAEAEVHSGHEAEEAVSEAGEHEHTEDSSEFDQVRRIKELEEENSELKDRYLRKQADFDNFRKRIIREKEESIKYANSNLLTDLVTIIDDFERAIRSSVESKDFESFHSGIEMIEKQLVSVLERKYGLTRIVSEGKEFDPQLHEAIGMVESPDYEVQTVVEDYQRGYMLHDRVLRHAKVRVAIPAPEKSEEVSETADQQ